MVKAVAKVFETDPDGVQRDLEALREGLAQNSTPIPGKEISPEIV